MTEIAELILNDIAKAVGIDSYTVVNLGIHLDLRKAVVDGYVASNRQDGNVAPNGTRNMLFDWKRNTSPNEQKVKLRKALIKAGLLEIANIYFPKGEGRCDVITMTTADVAYGKEETITYCKGCSDHSHQIGCFPKHPPAVARQKLYDRNPVSTQATSSSPAREIVTKRRMSVGRCPSILSLVHTIFQMIVALAIILAGSPVIVAGGDIIERVTLQAGKPGEVPFHLPWSQSNTFQGVLYFTIQFESKSRPFCINGETDIEGYKSPSQLPRFTTSVTYLDTSPCVHLIIDTVDTLDGDGYILTAVWHSFENVLYETIKKEIDVEIPQGPAKCFITLSENGDYSYEVHCHATTGSVRTTLSCYQNYRKIDVKGDITDNGQVTSGIFWLPDESHFSCCSHDVTLDVSETMCRDFAWPPGKETATQFANTVPTLVTKIIGETAIEHPETTLMTQMESHIVSGACRQFMLPSPWHFVYLFLYVAFVTMY